MDLHTARLPNPAPLARPFPHRWLSLFSGAEGLGLSVHLAAAYLGLEPPTTLCYVEREITACTILAARFADGCLCPAPIWSDISTFDGRVFRGLVDGIHGGFPCTDLSVAGKQVGIEQGEASGLWFEYIRIVDAIRPGYVWIENVPGILQGKNWPWVFGELAAIGYDAEWVSMRASDVGAPHQRKRAFVLAHTQHSRIEDGPRNARREGRQREAVRGGLNGRSEAVGHPRLSRLPHAKPEALRPTRGREERRTAIEPSSPLSLLPSLFPPGPEDWPAWLSVLRSRPDLAPAVPAGSRSPSSQSRLRGLADGVAVRPASNIMDGRIPRLRAGGNGVVALAGAAAFIHLWNRIDRLRNKE